MGMRITVALLFLSVALAGCSMMDDPAVVSASPIRAQAAGAAQVSAMRYAPAQPRYVPAFTHPEAGCDWVGVAGQVLDARSKPVSGVVVTVVGTFNGQTIRQSSASGASPTYGPGGYEIQLGAQSADSNGQLSIQLFDAGGAALSSPFSLVTFNDCQKNLVQYDFQALQTQANESKNVVYVPVVTR